MSATTTRRNILKKAFLTAGVISAERLASGRAATQTGAERVPVGLDAHSVRGMRWKAPQLLAYAAEQKLDAVLLKNLDVFESRDSAHLEQLKESASTQGLQLHFSGGSISESSTRFSDKFGSAQDLLTESIRVAKAIASPVVAVRIGTIADRYTDGGIEKNIEESVGVMNALRNRAEDAGVKFAFENHAGDLRSDELLGLIEAAGTGICGVMLDPGNALWAMEDPMRQVQMLGKHVLCTSVRDYMVWPTKDGATFQWTAIGDGLMDAPEFTRHMATLCPGVPLFVESISNSPRPIPFLTDDFWKGYPKLHPRDLVDFLTLLRRGHLIEVAKPPSGMDVREFAKQDQRAEFEKSIAYLRRNCGAGRK